MGKRSTRPKQARRQRSASPEQVYVHDATPRCSSHPRSAHLICRLNEPLGRTCGRLHGAVRGWRSG